MTGASFSHALTGGFTPWPLMNFSTIAWAFPEMPGI